MRVTGNGSARLIYNVRWRDMEVGGETAETRETE